MFFAVNLWICLFMLCVFGVLDAPLRELQLRPAVASALCLLAAGLFLLEDIEISPSLLCNLGGCMLPMAVALYFWAGARQGTRRYLIALGLLIGMGGYLFGQLSYQLLETSDKLAALMLGLFCALMSNLVEKQTMQVAFLCLFGFFSCDLLTYAVSFFQGQVLYLSMGGESEMAAILIMFVTAVSISRLRQRIETAWKRRKAAKEQGRHAQVEQTQRA